MPFWGILGCAAESRGYLRGRTSDHGEGFATWSDIGYCADFSTAATYEVGHLTLARVSCAA